MHQLRRKKKRGKKYVQLEKNKRRIIAMVNNTTTTINDENEKRKKLNKFCEKLMHNFEHVVTNTTELSYLSVSLFLTGIFLLFFFGHTIMVPVTKCPVNLKTKYSYSTLPTA